jgi:hypothetical protein
MGNGITACKGTCDFAISNDSAACGTGTGTCAQAELLEAEASGFHDENLIAATQQIRAILAAIPPDPAGRKLSFIRTNMGELLAWMDHSGAEVPDDAVTAEDDDATIAQALRLKGYAAAGATQA